MKQEPRFLIVPQSAPSSCPTKNRADHIYCFCSLWKTWIKSIPLSRHFNDLLCVPGMVPGQPQRASLAPPLEQKEQQWNVPLWRLNFLFTFKMNGEPCRARQGRVSQISQSVKVETSQHSSIAAERFNIRAAVDSLFHLSPEDSFVHTCFQPWGDKCYRSV